MLNNTEHKNGWLDTNAFEWFQVKKYFFLFGLVANDHFKTEDELRKATEIITKVINSDK